MVSNPYSIAPPRWEIDPNFDRRFHVRWVHAPAGGSMRSVLDCAEPIAMQGFDRARPLWELTVVDGLADDRAAMILKLHHSLSDGVGLVRMTTALVERTADAEPPPGPLPPLPNGRVLTQAERVVDALGHEWRRGLGRVRRVVGGVSDGVRSLVGNPLAVAAGLGDVAGSIGRMLRPVDHAAEPAHARPVAQRALRHAGAPDQPPEGRGEARARHAERRLRRRAWRAACGATTRRTASPVPALRMSMPINVREGETGAVAGNQFVPARFEVPVGIVSTGRAHDGDPRSGRTASAASRRCACSTRSPRCCAACPLAVSTALFGAMLKGIDFVTSNVPGPRFDVYVAGAKLEGVVGYGPLTGAATNVTLFSLRDHAHLGISTDPAAISDPDLFVTCLREGFREVLGEWE